MTQLKCHVIHCSSNKNQCCCRPDIKVDGPDACRSSETCCDSYTSIPAGATNDVGYREPNPRMPIACTAAHCVYNTKGKCTADSIQMDGSQAMAKNETACATFKNRQ